MEGSLLLKRWAVSLTLLSQEAATESHSRSASSPGPVIPRSNTAAVMHPLLSWLPPAPEARPAAAMLRGSPSRKETARGSGGPGQLGTQPTASPNHPNVSREAIKVQPAPANSR